MQIRLAVARQIELLVQYFCTTGPLSIVRPSVLPAKKGYAIRTLKPGRQTVGSQVQHTFARFGSLAQHKMQQKHVLNSQWRSVANRPLFRRDRFSSDPLGRNVSS